VREVASGLPIRSTGVLRRRRLPLLHCLLTMAVEQQGHWQRGPRAMGKARSAKDSSEKSAWGGFRLCLALSG